MEQLDCLKSARTKTIDSTGCIDCIDSIDPIESDDFIDTIDSIDFIDPIDAILVPHKRSPTFIPHTKGKQQYRWGARAARARPIGTIVGACEARAPFVCGVNVGDL